MNKRVQATKGKENGPVIALAGNPNAGKSTIFNFLTGLKQHTGNWTGKTVENAYGYYDFSGEKRVLVDLPGTYSLLPRSKDEEAARDFICFHHPDAIIVVVDATMLERHMNLALQIIEANPNTVICVNLIDEAKRKGILIDICKMRQVLGVPVVATNAKNGEGIFDLLQEVENLIHRPNTTPLHIPQEEEIDVKVKSLTEKTNSRWTGLKLLENDKTTVEKICNLKEYNSVSEELLSEAEKAREELCEQGIDTDRLSEMISQAYYRFSSRMAAEVLEYTNPDYQQRDRKIDRLLTSKLTGIPLMLFFLGVILWLTIVGANYPSQVLSTILFGFERQIESALYLIHTPSFLVDVLVSGMYRTLAWVISVMLPPMAIFFPLFTLLEDIGYLPRIAFNLDKSFCRACAHGKQALTTCMGFGCNAVGVSGCNIIDSPRERLVAILTNSFIPCNGRFPTIILLVGILVNSLQIKMEATVSVLVVLLLIVLSVAMMLLASKLLSKTVLKGYPSHFLLELPPYRKPKIRSIIVRSVLDRTVYVLGRAVSVAAPAGIVIYLLANITFGGETLLGSIALFLDPFARFFGLDGYILLAFLLGIPANEIVLPILIMGYTSLGSLTDIGGIETLRQIFIDNGWTFLTLLNVTLFMLMHFPCATTLLTIKKETKSVKWTLLAFVLPTLFGLGTCFITNSVYKLLIILQMM